MKSKLLEKKKYPPTCEYCKSGRLAPDNQTILCVKKGLVKPENKCSKFRYDPLKRRPKMPPIITAVNPTEFEL